MKLVELLARELSEWPEGAKNITQDHDGGVSPCTDPLGDLEFDGSRWTSTLGFHIGIGIIESRELSSDYKTAIVTRAQWQAERNRQKGGEWKRHRGGKMPVEKGVMIEVKHRDGEVYEDKAGETYSRDWSHTGAGGDIMKYRVISQPQAGEVEYRGPFPCAPAGEPVTELEWDIQFQQGVFHMEAKTDQIDGPIKWRDTVNELDAYIEEFTRERDALIERLASEGFALIPPVVSVVSEFSGADMSDWRNWQVGDIIRKETSKHPSMMGVGDEGEITMIDNDHATNPIHIGPFYVPHVTDLKFVRRP